MKIDAGPPPTPSVRTGELDALVRAGLLDVGEELIWERRGASHRAVVVSGGALQLADGRIFESPSGAARALAGYEVNGWRNWARARDGVRLASLRDQI
ncbi:restriction system modified-DNA reader domain-containing protein [Actinoplanes derwentensis]|uniref:restriction system modified-DNA reader domain-containing protein n=1 Tax=Actinoplanes derwentensis TaxID=113562 RepID=UPI0035A25F65